MIKQLSGMNFVKTNRFETLPTRSSLIVYQTNKGVCAHFSILSPARATFWRHASLIKELYTHFSKNTLTQDDFIVLVDEILSAKKTLKKYNKHFDKLSANDKIEVVKASEKLEVRVVECEKEIDAMVYELYGLSEDEIGIVEGN